jgi:hypothetical protein
VVPERFALAAPHRLQIAALSSEVLALFGPVFQPVSAHRLRSAIWTNYSSSVLFSRGNRNCSFLAFELQDHILDRIDRGVCAMIRL